MMTRTPRATGLLAAALTVTLVAASAVVFYTRDGGGEVYRLDVGWAGRQMSKVCVYDPATETMTALLRVRAATDTTGRVEVHLRAGVWHTDDTIDEKYETTTSLTLNQGRTHRKVPVVIDLPRTAHADGFTRCFVSMDYDRAEPWD